MSSNISFTQHIKHSFLFNTLFALLVNFAIKPIWVFLIDRTVQNQLGSETYGMYFAIFNFTYLFQIFLDFGLQNFNQTEIGSDNSKFGKSFAGILSVKLVLIVIYLLLSVSVAYSLGYASYSFFPWLIINQILLSLNIFLRSNISAHRQFIKDSFLSVLDKSLMIIGCLFMLAPWGWITLSIDHFVWIQTVALSITTLFCIFYNLHLSSSFQWEFDFKFFKSIVGKAVPFALIYFFMTIYYRIDSVMIEKMLGAKGALETGIYAQSYRIMESVNNIGYVVAGVLLPLFAYHLGKKSSIQQVLQQGYNIMLTVIVPIVAGACFYAEDIISTLYTDTQSDYSSMIFTVLALNFIPVGFLYVLGPLLTAGKVFKVMIPCLFTATLLNISINYLSIPTWGALGAAFATFFTQIFVLLVYSISTLILFKISIRMDTLWKTIGYITLIMALDFALKSSAIHWMYAIVISGICSVCLALLLRIIGKSTLQLKIS